MSTSYDTGDVKKKTQIHIADKHYQFKSDIKNRSEVTHLCDMRLTVKKDNFLQQKKEIWNF